MCGRSPFLTAPSSLKAPNNNKSSYLPSSTHIFGITVVNSAVSVPDKPQTVLIEAAFWNRQELVLSLFRYYNAAPGILFEPNEKCFIHSTVGFTVICSISYI